MMWLPQRMESARAGSGMSANRKTDATINFDLQIIAITSGSRVVI
jgi:hypothetical protein